MRSRGALVSKGIPPEAIIEALILGFEWPHELDEPLRHRCQEFADSSIAIVVSGVVYPSSSCGEPYPLSGGDEPTTTVVQESSTEGAWTGSGSSTNSSESLSTTRSGSGVVELRDGIYTLSFEMESQSTMFGHDECSTTTSAFGPMDGTPDEFGKILFVAEVTADIVSDCKLYESSSGFSPTSTNTARPRSSTSATVACGLRAGDPSVLRPRTTRRPGILVAMSQPTVCGGFAHRWGLGPGCDEPTDRMWRFRSSLGTGTGL